MTERSGAKHQEGSILANPEAASLKRVAWAYGCAKKDSDEECQLRDILLRKARQEHLNARDCDGTPSTIPAPSLDLSEPASAPSDLSEPSVACEICAGEVSEAGAHFSTTKGRSDGFWRCHRSAGKVRCAKCDHVWKPRAAAIPVRCPFCGESGDLFWADDGGWERAAAERVRSRSGFDYDV